MTKMTEEQWYYEMHLCDTQEEYNQKYQAWLKRFESLHALGWIVPWLGTGYADGTPMLDGNPLFSAWHPQENRGVCIGLNRKEVYEPDDILLTYWIDTFDDTVKYLNIASIMDPEHEEEAFILMKNWIEKHEVPREQ